MHRSSSITSQRQLGDTYRFAQKVAGLGILELVLGRTVEDTDGLQIQSTVFKRKQGFTERTMLRTV